MNKWNKFPDVEPLDDGEYIVMIEDSNFPTTLTYRADEGKWYDKYDFFGYNVTHWMKLPEPPKTEKEHCCFCGNEINHGHDPRPVKVSGNCCDECNIKIVVPLRISIAGRSESNA